MCLTSISSVRAHSKAPVRLVLVQSSASSLANQRQRTVSAFCGRTTINSTVGLVVLARLAFRFCWLRQTIQVAAREASGKVRLESIKWPLNERVIGAK